jgi:hypothetical protein
MADKDSVQIKKQLSEKLPEYKFSVTRSDFAGGHSVSVRVLSGPFEFFASPEARENANGYFDVWRDSYKEDERVNAEIKPDIDKMYKIIYDIGQFPSGYHGGPYLHWNFGSYSKPYQVTASKKSTTAPQKSSGQTNADSELLMSFSQGWNLYKTTINKTGTDGNPLTLVVYNLGKTKELKNIPYDKFLEFKGEMLTNLGMKWVNGFAKFEKWTFPPDSDILKVIIDKYYGVGENKEETPTPQPTPKSSKMSVKLLADYLMTHDSTVWDRLKIESGSQLYADDRLQKSYIKIWTDYYESDTAIPTQMKELSMKERNELGDYFEDDNYHSLKNLFMLYGYFGMDNKVSAEQLYAITGHGLNPKNFKPKEKEEEDVKVGDKFLVVNSGKTFVIDYSVKDSVGERFGVIYSDGLTNTRYKSDIVQGLKENIFIKVKDEEFKAGDVYYSKLFEQKLTIDKVQEDTIFVNYEDESSERYTPQYCRLMIERGDWIKVVDEEKEEGGSQEDIKKGIAALEILAEDGDEDAKKGIEALKILLN